MAQERLQKYLAACGVASRRAAEVLIKAGRVAIDGLVVREMGVVIDPTHHVVSVDGKRIRGAEQHVYIALYKPSGVVSTAHDDRGRRTVIDLLQGVSERVYPVGRLDYASEGLVLLTNDGELAGRLMHPRHHVPKVYTVVVEPNPAPGIVRRLAAGVDLEDGRTLPANVQVTATWPYKAEMRFELREGRNRQIRRMCAAVGLSVVTLKRMQIGPLKLGNLKVGEWRHLAAAEVQALQRATGLLSSD